MSTVTKVISAIILVVLLLAVVFCVTALIMGCVNGTGFVQEIQNWFTSGTVDDAVETTRFLF